MTGDFDPHRLGLIWSDAMGWHFPVRDDIAAAVAAEREACARIADLMLFYIIGGSPASRDEDIAAAIRERK